jgi:hypothetical protein
MTKHETLAIRLVQRNRYLPPLLPSDLADDPMIFDTPPPPTSDYIRETRTQFDLSQHAFADLLGVHYRTVENWEAGGKVPVFLTYTLRWFDLHPHFITEWKRSR